MGSGSGGWWEVGFPVENEGKPEGGGDGGGCGVGTGKGTGKSMRTRLSTLLFAEKHGVCDPHPCQMISTNWASLAVCSEKCSNRARNPPNLACQS